VVRVSSIRASSVFLSGVNLRFRTADAADNALPRGPLLTLRFTALFARGSAVAARSELVQSFWDRNHACGRSWVNVSVGGGAVFAVGVPVDAQLADWGGNVACFPSQDSEAPEHRVGGSR